MAFEKVSTQATLSGCVRKKDAWSMITDFAKYPELMENVDKVEVIERADGEGLSRWYLSIDGAPLFWTEKDYFNPRSFEIMFKSIDGDLDNINGRWRISNSVASGIAIDFELEYNLGIPVIEEVLGPVLKEKMKTNIDTMISAVQKSLYSSAKEERKEKRHAIDSSHACSINGRPLYLHVLNVSSSGMMTRFVPDLTDIGTVGIGGTDLDIAALHPDEAQNLCRFVFTKAMDPAAFDSLVNNLSAGSARMSHSTSAPREALVFSTRDEVPVRILELTPTGMSFTYEGTQPPELKSLTIGKKAVGFKEIVRDDQRNLVSVRFADPLSIEQYDWACDHFRVTKKI